MIHYLDLSFQSFHLSTMRPHLFFQVFYLLLNSVDNFGLLVSIGLNMTMDFSLSICYLIYKRNCIQYYRSHGNRYRDDTTNSSPCKDGP